MQIDVPKLNKKITGFISFIFNFTLSIFKSYLLLTRKKIEILISTGGYMSLPICLAARSFKFKNIFI